MTETDPFKQLHDLVLLLGQNGQTAYVALSTQILDGELEKFIISRMPNYSRKVHEQMFAYPAPLSSFAAKIAAAYAFGFIDRKLHASLSNIRRIRNEFAHPQVETHFRSPHIKQLLKNSTATTTSLTPMRCMTTRSASAGQPSIPSTD